MISALWMIVLVLTANKADDLFVNGFDWLVDIKDATTPSKVIPTAHGFKLTNGLIEREFLFKNQMFTTIGFFDIHKTNSSIFRAVSPEIQLTIDGLSYTIGGVNLPSGNTSQCLPGYFNMSACLDDPISPPSIRNDSFIALSYKEMAPVAPFPYTPMRGAPQDIVWPPAGRRVDIQFRAPPFAPKPHQSITATLHYEIYDGIPLVTKWLTIQSSVSKVVLSLQVIEQLAVNQPWKGNQFQPHALPAQNSGWLHVQINEPHGANVSFADDPRGKQMPGAFASLITCSYQHPLPQIEFQGGLDSFKVHELVHGSSDREEESLARGRMFRLLAPHAQENPLFVHMENSLNTSVRNMIDQLADVGFEMMIFGVRSNIMIEDTSENNTARFADMVRYARSKGIEVGAYDLISLSRQDPLHPEWDAVNASGMSIGSMCFASGWSDYLKQQIDTFYEKTGMTAIETDGPYGGMPCSSTNHSHHNNVKDSVFWQNKIQANFYRKYRTMKWFINQPDEYFYDGGNKAGYGYSEGQFRLPRWQDVHITRQTIYQGSYYHIPPSGWMGFPLSPDDPKNPGAGFEPMSQNMESFNLMMGQIMGAGVAGILGGFRIYDTPATRAIVMKWVSFYKQYRGIINKDILHIKYPTMQDIDGFMHVDPKEKMGLAMVFNPLYTNIVRKMQFPLYYTGIRADVAVSQEGAPQKNPTIRLLYGYQV